MIKNKQNDLKLRESMIKEGLEITYIDRIISNLPIERKLSSQPISTKLKYTNILLFKAMLEAKNSLKYNNIDKLITNQTQLRLLNIFNISHENILNEEKFIAKEIIKFKKQQKF